MHTSRGTNIILSIIALCLALNVFITVFRPRPADAAPAGRLEYNFGYWDDMKEIVPNLDEMNRKGWRPIGYSAPNPNTHFFVFERPLR